MKTCAKCGHVNFKPKDKCPKCGDKYSGYSCDPLSASTTTAKHGGITSVPRNEGAVNGYITTGDPNARHNRDYENDR